ncbi:TetR/AcrR family transcriptional regulator [Sphingomonas sp. S2-65]|uniref:TetR/AcrR family transcriptional regulator n=1 Tax=Sphingomonas sp. S2-65 TaxID=2903960 RepID=UPI001F3F6C43|nr:TetR/AcrR family transcriptional regulator [Sphingomonas sp. S2-65]UYY57105.1 TetR/AcrR family transcriptional regulator [Sphingomonas sp. S2-65]
MHSEALDGARRRGRPRNADLDDAIREAAWALIANVGCEALTFEAIAQAVGCSRSTLYRRFATKADMVSHMLDETARSFAPQLPPDAPPRELLLAHAATCSRMYAGSRGGALLHIAAAARRDATIARAFDAHQGLVAPHYRAPLRLLAAEACDASLDFALQTLMGSVVHHVATRRHKLSALEIERLVDAAISLANA